MPLLATLRNFCSQLAVLSLLGFSLWSLLTATAHASDFSILPSIAVSEDYTDNIFQTQTDRKTDFITHLSPGLEFNYQAPFWDWDLAYLLDYRYYARKSQKNELSHNLDAKGKLRIIKNFLFLDITDTFKKVSLDVNRDTTTDSTFVNQADQNILTVAPYIEFRPGANFLVKSGYHYTRESYPNASSGNTTSSGIDREEHGAFISTALELNPKTTITTNFAYTHVVTGHDLSYQQLLPSLGTRYEYADKSFVSLEGGYSWFLYDNGPTTSNPYWNIGITHAFDHAVVSLNTSVTYNTDPLQASTEQQDVTARLEKTMSRGFLSLFATYSKLSDNQQDSLSSKKYGVGGNIKYEFTEKITGHLDLTGEKVDEKTNNNINYDITAPYRFFISAGVGYTLANNLTLTLDYSYTTYRESIGSSANSTDINRVILGLTKSFGSGPIKMWASDSAQRVVNNEQRSGYSEQ
jgi:hypothetical protein